jgi:hypothetical protein
VGLFVWDGFLPESPTTRAVLDGIEVALNVIVAAALAVSALAILTVVVAAIGWHATLPVAVAVVPFAVFIGAALGLWLLGRGDFPGGG